MVSAYFSAIWETWEGKMSGIASLFLTLVATYSTFFAGQEGISRVKVYLWVAAALCFVFANYKAWEKKAKKVQELTLLIEDRRPKLILAIGGSVWTYDSATNKTVFFLSAELLNQGEPTVAIGWSAKYVMGTFSEPMTSFYIHGFYTVTVGVQKLTVTTQDLLNVKTQSTQIERGGHRGGRLLFTLDGDRRRQIETLQFNIEVSCKDYLFTVYTAKYSPTPQAPGGLHYLPTERVEPINAPPILSVRDTPKLKR